MLDWLKAAQWAHSVFAVLAAIGCFRFLLRTRFWFPRYLHWIAAIALAIGIAFVPLIPAEAPVNHGSWAGLKRAMVLLFFPGIVYIAFVSYGGQRAAYEARRPRAAVPCPHCGDPGSLPGDACGSCGQTIPPRHDQGAWDKM